MTNKLCIAFFSLVLFQTGLGAADPNGYEIKFNLPDIVGDQHRVQATGSETKTMTLRRNGRTVKRDRKVIKSEFDFDITVASVSARKAADKIDIVVRKLTTSDGSVSLPPGTKVRVEVVDGDESFSIDGKVVSKELDSFLDRVVSIDTGGTDNDGQFGTKERQKIGHHWDVKKAGMVADAKQHGHAFQSDNISGHVKLERLTQVKGTECLQIRVISKVNEFSDKAARGFEVVSSSISMDTKVLLPVDQSTPALEESQRVNMRAKMESVSQPGMTLEISSVFSLKTEFSYQRQ